MKLKPASTKRVEQLERGRLVRRPAEHVAAEDQRRDLEPRICQVCACPWFLPERGTFAPILPMPAPRPRRAQLWHVVRAQQTVASGRPFAGASASWPTRPARHRPTNCRRFRAAARASKPLLEVAAAGALEARGPASLRPCGRSRGTTRCVSGAICMISRVMPGVITEKRIDDDLRCAMEP